MHYLKYKEIKNRGTVNFPAGYYHVTESHPQYTMPYHWHEELELISIAEGTFEVTINETTRTAHAGDLLLAGSGALHGGTPLSCVYECLVFSVSLLLNRTYSSDFLDRLDQQDIILDEYYPAAESPHLHELADTLFSLFKNQEEENQLQCLGLLYQFMGVLYLEKRYTASSKYDLKSHKNVYLLKQVLSYIADHYSEKIELNTLARTAGMSPKYFCHFFLEMTGHTPIDYVNYYRIERACYFLVNTNHSITDTALLCGFSDASYFTRTFKKYKNRTPGQYLKHPF